MVRNSNICDCGHEFDIHEINGLNKINDSKFYGGNVDYYSDTNCPECNRKTRLYLRQKGQTYEIVDTEYIEDDIETAIPKNTNENVNIDEKDTEQESICPVCQKVCKNKSGLALHMKSHEK